MSSLDGYETAFARIDGLVERAVEQGQAPGVVAAVARGEIVHVATAGVMAVGGAPMRRDTLFRISSTTKPITSQARSHAGHAQITHSGAPGGRLPRDCPETH